MKPSINNKYLWSKEKDIVQVKDMEKDLALIEMKVCSDKKYNIGDKFWVFIKDLRERQYAV